MEFRKMPSQCEVGDAVLLDAMIDAPPHEQLEDAGPDPQTGKPMEVPFCPTPASEPMIFSLQPLERAGGAVSSGWVRIS